MFLKNNHKDMKKSKTFNTVPCHRPQRPKSISKIPCSLFLQRIPGERFDVSEETSPHHWTSKSRPARGVHGISMENRFAASEIRKKISKSLQKWIWTFWRISLRFSLQKGCLLRLRSVDAVLAIWGICCNISLILLV